MSHRGNDPIGVVILVGSDPRGSVVFTRSGKTAEFRFSCIHVNPSFGILSSSCIYIPPFTITEVPAPGAHDD